MTAEDGQQPMTWVRRDGMIGWENGNATDRRPLSRTETQCKLCLPVKQPGKMKRGEANQQTSQKLKEEEGSSPAGRVRSDPITPSLQGNPPDRLEVALQQEPHLGIQPR